MATVEELEACIKNQKSVFLITNTRCRLYLSDGLNHRGIPTKPIISADAEFKVIRKSNSVNKFSVKSICGRYQHLLLFPHEITTTKPPKILPL